MRLVAFLCVIASAAGCARFPELEAAVPAEVANAPYPALIPLDSSFDALRSSVRVGPDELSDLQARVARLRARAAILRAAS